MLKIRSFITKLFNSNDSDYLEQLARKAAEINRQYFGKTVSLYAPLYIANFCENNCLYCGFNSAQKIERIMLSAEEIEAECLALSDNGVQTMLLLTGESRKSTPLSYIEEAVRIAKKYFSTVLLEVYPMETEEYHQLFLAGAEGVTLYQETYDRARYAEVHLSGKKKEYDYRYQAIERIAQAGMRQISMGVLLGLSNNLQEDIITLFEHLDHMFKTYPGVEYSLAFPRIQKLTDWSFDHQPVSDELLVKAVIAARILFPRVDINISTRESNRMRDNLLNIAVTRMSAGSLTTVGGYRLQKSQGKQFSINDDRSWDEVKTDLITRGFDPILTGWRSFENS